MNGINAPKVVECRGSDGRIYRQLAKSGNDDLRQDAVRIRSVSLSLSDNIQSVCTCARVHADTCTLHYYFLPTHVTSIFGGNM